MTTSKRWRRRSTPAVAIGFCGGSLRSEHDWWAKCTSTDRMLEMMDRITLDEKPGWHGIYVREDGAVVVEWYDFGDHAPYESVNMVIFNAEGQARLGSALGLPATADPEVLMKALERRFKSYFAVRKFVDAQAIPHEHKVDFWP